MKDERPFSQPEQGPAVPYLWLVLRSYVRLWSGIALATLLTIVVAVASANLIWPHLHP